jgi:N-acylglucosamine 2-epimerase
LTNADRIAWLAGQLESSRTFWLQHSLDREYGGYWTCLDTEGAVYDSRKYVWLMGRAAWMFSKLGDADTARRILDFVLRHGRDADGRFYFSLERDGRPAFFQRKPYGAMFVAIGCAEFARLTGESRYLDEAVRLFWQVREWIADPELLGRARHGLSQLADVMVTISMLQEIMPSHDDPRYPDLLNAMLDEALAHQHQELGVFVENIRASGEFFEDAPAGRLWCPGHSAEVSWFLLRILDQYPDNAKRQRVLENLEQSLTLGWDREFGGLFYFLDTRNRPLMELEWDMKLWWPHVEALLAVAHAWGRTGDARWLTEFDRHREYSNRVFVDRQYGEWFGYASREGRVTHPAKGNSYKGFFHVPRAMYFAQAELTAPAKK